ncbi:MAG: hypothetical protein ACHQ1D_05630 [Nitrososphaerales archaeon]
MSSKNLNKKFDDKIDKAEQEALKEAEIVAELAPNEEIRKEAEELIETVETQEIFDTYKQDVLKMTERVSKFQPQYAEAISKLQQEYIQLMKQIVDNVFAVQREWAGSNVTSTNTTFPTLTFSPYAEQVRNQSNEITAQALSVFNTSNQLAINALHAARENVKLYGKAMESIMDYNNNVANAWSSFFTSAQRQQYFRQ